MSATPLWSPHRPNSARHGTGSKHRSPSLLCYRNLRKIQEQYDRLKYQLSQKNLRESSLVQAYRLQGNTYWAQLPSGVVREFTDFVFEYVRLYCLTHAPTRKR